MIKRSKCENKGIVPTEMELVLEYTQQGASHEVSVILRVLRIILVILPEHPSDNEGIPKKRKTTSIEPTSNKLLGSFKDGDEDGDTQCQSFRLNSDIIFFSSQSAPDGNKLLDERRLSLADGSQEKLLIKIKQVKVNKAQLFSIYSVWNLVDTAYRDSMDTAYQGFLGEIHVSISLLGSVPEYFLQSLKFLQHQLFRSLEDWEVSSLQCVTVEVPQTLEYRGGQLNAAPVLEVENFTNWKKRFMCHIIAPLSTAFFSTSIVQDFQDSPDDEEDTRNSHEYLNDLEEGYQARALLAKSKRYFKEVKAKLALLSSSASTPSLSLGKNKGLIAKTYDWDDEEVSSDENEVTKVKALMALTDEERVLVGKESARNGDWTKISMESFNKVNQCTVKQIPSQRRNSGSDQLTEDPFQFRQKTSLCKNLQLMTQSGQLPGVDRDPETDYDSADESSVCSTPLPPLKKLEGVEPISGPKTIKSILKSKSTLKAKALKGVIINEPFSAPAKGNKSSSASKVHSAHAGKLKSVKIEDDPSLAIEREINPINPQHAFKRCEACGSSNHTTTHHYDIEWFKRGEALQAKKAEALKSTKAESSNANRSKTPTKSGYSRHMTGVKSYLHKYVEQLGPKVGFSSFSSPYTPEQNGVAMRKNRTLIEATRTMLSGSVFSKQYWTEAVATAFRVFNTRRQQIEETYHFTFDESPKAINSQNLQLTTSTLLKQKDIYLMNIFILMNLLKGAGMLTRAMAKQLSAASAHECLFVDFLFEEEPKKVSEALKHPG
ncbi:retrovirus-related pol polyprotein from transposon TNT 1-94 [Tanacetum coccineum]